MLTTTAELPRQQKLRGKFSSTEKDLLSRHQSLAANSEAHRFDCTGHGLDGPEDHLGRYLHC